MSRSRRGSATADSSSRLPSPDLRQKLTRESWQCCESERATLNLSFLSSVDRATRKPRAVAPANLIERSVVQGYFNYHAVPGNLASLRSFRLQVIRRWMRALRRRSQKSRMTWPRLTALAERWLPKPSILHPYPNLRFDARHPR
jgi:hypothetical protein